MEKNESRLTIFFEDPFWVGICERRGGGTLAVCRVVFGPEPQDCQVYDWILSHWNGLPFGPPVPEEGRPEDADPRPMRRRRQAGRELESRGVGTKSQQALQLQREQAAHQKKRRRAADRRERQQAQFRQKQEKKKQKHRGR